MRTFEISGFYGVSRKSECVVFTAETDGGTWYAVEGGTIVNFTYDEVHDGIYVEEISDADCFTWNKPINSINDLIEAIEA